MFNNLKLFEQITEHQRKSCQRADTCSISFVCWSVRLRWSSPVSGQATFPRPPSNVAASSASTAPAASRPETNQSPCFDSNSHRNRARSESLSSSRTSQSTTASSTANELPCYSFHGKNTPPAYSGSHGGGGRLASVVFEWGQAQNRRQKVFIRGAWHIKFYKNSTDFYYFIF